MKIREINAMKGPNYWSVRRHKLIVMVLDLEEMEERPSNEIEGFRERLGAMFPTMYEHRCSVIVWFLLIWKSRLEDMPQKCLSLFVKR